jgi:ComF family protein
MPARMWTLRAALVGFLDLVAPLRCLGCEVELEGAARFCGACAPLLERAPPGAGAAFSYGGPLADAIRRLKYGGRSESAAPLGALLADRAVELAGRIDRVVPVPLHAGRLAARGYDQAALLALPVARRLGVPLDTGALRRVRATRVQASLPREHRVANVRAAFAARGVEGRRVLVIDDVRTTGATLGEACAAILAARASSVTALALAAVEGDRDEAAGP